MSGRTAKQEQERISPNHIPTIFHFYVVHGEVDTRKLHAYLQRKKTHFAKEMGKIAEEMRSELKLSLSIACGFTTSPYFFLLHWNGISGLEETSQLVHDYLNRMATHFTGIQHCSLLRARANQSIP